MQMINLNQQRCNIYQIYEIQQKFLIQIIVFVKTSRIVKNLNKN